MWEVAVATGNEPIVQRELNESFESRVRLKISGKEEQQGVI